MSSNTPETLDMLKQILSGVYAERTPFINPLYQFPDDMPPNMQDGIRQMSYKVFAGELRKAQIFESSARFLTKKLIEKGVIMQHNIEEDDDGIKTRELDGYTVYYTPAPRHLVMMALSSVKSHHQGLLPDYPAYFQWMKAKTAEYNAEGAEAGFTPDDFKDEAGHSYTAPMYCNMLDLIQSGGDTMPNGGGLLGMLMAMLEDDDEDDDSPSDLSPVDDLGNRLVETDD